MLIFSCLGVFSRVGNFAFVRADFPFASREFRGFSRVIFLMCVWLKPCVWALDHGLKAVATERCAE